MYRLYNGLKEAIKNDDFLYFNNLLQHSVVSETAHFEDNYALKEVYKKGILSSMKNLLKIDAVWFSFKEDELMHLARQYPQHKGAQRLIEKCALQRFQYLLTKSVSFEESIACAQTFENSKFLNNNASHGNNLFLKLAITMGSLTLVTLLLKNNKVREQCGLNELYLALKHSKHPGIVRELLKNESIIALLDQEHSAIEEALAENDFQNVTDFLFCFADIDDESAMDQTPIEPPGKIEVEMDEIVIHDTAESVNRGPELSGYSLFMSTRSTNKRPRLDEIEEEFQFNI